MDIIITSMRDQRHWNSSWQKTKAAPLFISGSHMRVKLCQCWSQLRGGSPIMRVPALTQTHVCLCMCSFHITGEGAEVQCVCCSHSSCESQRALVLFLHYLTVLQKRMPSEADRGTLSLWWTCSIIEYTLKTLMQSSSQWGLSLCHSVCVTLMCSQVLLVDIFSVSLLVYLSISCVLKLHSLL